MERFCTPVCDNVSVSAKPCHGRGGNELDWSGREVKKTEFDMNYKTA